jgi:hypothetical protein
MRKGEHAFIFIFLASFMRVVMKRNENTRPNVKKNRI